MLKSRASTHKRFESPISNHRYKILRDDFLYFVNKYLKKYMDWNDAEISQLKSYYIDGNSNVISNYIPGFISSENRFNTESFVNNTLYNDDVDKFFTWIQSFCNKFNYGVAYFYDDELLYISGIIKKEQLHLDFNSIVVKNQINNFKKIFNNKKYSVHIYTSSCCNDIGFKIHLRPEYLYRHILTNDINDIMDKMLVIEC